MWRVKSFSTVFPIFNGNPGSLDPHLDMITKRVHLGQNNLRFAWSSVVGGTVTESEMPGRALPLFEERLWSTASGHPPPQSAACSETARLAELRKFQGSQICLHLSAAACRRRTTA